MKKKLAFVLGGGGALGALQVGALRALQEAGIKPDLLVGTSVGAANAAFLAINGYNHESIVDLVKLWHRAANANLLPANYLWLTVRALFNRSSEVSALHIQQFWIENGLKGDIKFSNLQGPQLLIVATDLASGQPILFGKDPNDCILEAVMASAAVPPWVSPIPSQDRLLLDGGILSNLPIEPALSAGASEIIALDLLDGRPLQDETQQNLGTFLAQVLKAIDLRHQDLEEALAKACNVHVTHVRLLGEKPHALWDFSHTDELITRGYNLMQQELTSRPERTIPWWKKLTNRLKS